ncbi:MAG: hypothetical protein RL354_1393 [Planctomycetota bacterium]
MTYPDFPTRNPLVLDIETVPLAASLAMPYPEATRFAPANYKTDEAIAKWRDADRIKWYEDRAKECSLNPRLGRIVVIGTNVDTIVAPAEADEREALVRFEAPSAEQAAAAPSDGSVLQARSLHELTLELDRKGMPKPYIAAWVVAIFELIGGGLLLVGLFSRVWAGGIAFWAVALFGLSSWQAMSLSDLWATNVPARASMIGLVTIATLALGIAFSGAGAFSLDAMIFRKGGGGGGGDDAGE